jgi:hypothetical protein
VVECHERTERALDCLESESSVNTPIAPKLHIALAVTLVYTMSSME